MRLSDQNKISLMYALSFLVAACSILYELILAQTISLLVANMVFWYSTTIGLYLAAMGWGAWSFGRYPKDKAGWELFLKVESLLALTGALCVLVIYFGHMIFGFFWEMDSVVGVLVFFTLFFTLVITIGFLSGIEMPLLIKLGNEFSKDRVLTNRILGADYFGSLLGAVSFPLVFLPHLELIDISFIVAVVNVTAAFCVLIVFLPYRPFRFKIVSLLTLSYLAILLLTGLAQSDRLNQYFLKKFYYRYRSNDSLTKLFFPVQAPRVERFNSPYQKIDLVHYPPAEGSLITGLMNKYSLKFEKFPDYPRHYKLFLNGDYQWSSDYEEIYHEFFAHVPVILNRQTPENILVLGGGDGLLLKELLKYHQVHKITLVELDRKILGLVDKNPVLNRMAPGVLRDPRVFVTIADAFHFMKNNKDQFDAIYVDFPLPSDYNVTKLYSLEFYVFVKKALNQNGFAVINAPGIEFFTDPAEEGVTRMLPENRWPVYYHTLKAAGFKTIVPYLTLLEGRNQKAIMFLYEAMGGDDDYKFARSSRKILFKDLKKRNLARAMIRKYVFSLRQGFIMVKRSGQPVIKEYQILPVDLQALNQTRFALAFTNPFETPESVDPDQINFLMRPKVFEGAQWYWPKLP